MQGFQVVIIVGFKLAKIVSNVLEKSMDKAKMDEGLRSFLKSIIKYLIKIIVLITAASVMEIPMTTFIALLSAAGLAVGLALKDSLSNFAAGVMILVSKPFLVGDFIETQGYMGTVKQIQLLYTIMNTPDNRRVMIPNSEVAGSKLINFTAEETRRVDMTFGVSYSDDIYKVKEILTRLVDNHPLTLKDPEPIIKVMSHGDSSVNFVVRVWCERANYWTIFFDFQEQVKVEFDKENISIPFPQRDVHLYQK